MYRKQVITYLYIIFLTVNLVVADLSVIDISLYIGCFKDKEDDRDITTNVPVTDVTPQKCIDACLARDSNYRYAAMQWGRECYCGLYAGKWATLPEGSCSYACFGDDSQMCGGWFSSTVYLTKIPVAEEGDYIGCFRDEADSDLYGYTYEDHTDNSPDTCTNTCRTKGYLYAGVQYSRFCHCGNYYGRYGAARDSECSSSCTGNSALKCGGSWKNSIYSTGCFQAPTCTDQYNGSISDTHPIGDELFTVNVPDPDVYFTGQYFDGLSFAIENTTLDAVSINASTGKITTTGNIIVYPSYPTSNFSIVVRVGNSHSCGNTAICTMTLEVAFKNWPIRIDTAQVPENVTVDEDCNERKQLIIVYVDDDNGEDQDNVTCILSNNPDPSLIELVHDGNHKFNSYSVWKRECTVPGCGVLCKGCLESKAITEYDVDVECFDAYGSSDSHRLKLLVKENEPPTLLNLPATVNASNTDNLGDVIFSTTVDNLPMNESIEFELKSGVSDSYELGTEDLFSLNTSNGEVYLNSDPRQEFSQTFEMTICVKDRRHEVCANLTINFYGCFQTPTCNDQSNFTLSDSHEVGAVLFNMDVPVPTGVFRGQTFSGLRFSIANSSLDVATINTTTGTITTTDDITVDSSHPSQNFSIVVRVANGESCDHTSTCTMTMSVFSANWLSVSIENLPAEVTISEDNEGRLHLKTIDTNLPGQDVSCSIANTAGSTLFEMVDDMTASPPTHSVWKKKCSGASCLDHHIVPKYVIVVTCTDSYGNSDTKNLTVIIADEPVAKTEFVNIIFVTTLAVGVVLVLAIVIGCILKTTQNMSVIQPTATTHNAANIPNGAPQYSSITNQPRAAIVETGSIW